MQTESALLRTKEQSAQDAARRLQRSLREARDEASSVLAREQESTRARREIEKSLEAAEAETKLARDDLRLALQRIDDLQSAIQGELDLDCSEEGTTENSDRYFNFYSFHSWMKSTWGIISNFPCFLFLVTDASSCRTSSPTKTKTRSRRINA